LALVLVAASVASAQLVYPQPLYGQPPNQNVLALDYPAPGAWVSQDALYFAGWAFNCTGAQVQDIYLLVYDPQAANGGMLVRWPAQLVMGVHRPDVAQHYYATGTICRVSDYSGFHLYPMIPLPNGAIAYAVCAWNEGGYWDAVTGLFHSASAAVNDRFLIVR
jgi:hypothetical protein